MTHRMHQLLLPLLLTAGVLFFGCGRKPGDKLYQEALSEWQDGNLVRARTLLEKSIHRRAGSLENAEACNQLGLLLWEMNETAGAVDAFSESLRIDAAQPDVLCNLGVALSARNDLAGAERIFREASLMNPDDARPLAYAGVVYLRSGKWEDALRNLQKAVNRTPNDPRLQNALALAELYTAGPAKAIQRLKATTQASPGYAPACFNMASIIRDWQKDRKESDRWFNIYLSKTSETDPFAKTARNRLNEGLTTGIPYTPPKQRDRAAAEQRFRVALGLQKVGQLQKAEEEYIKAIELDDLYEPAFYNLGLVYYSDNRLALAAEAFNNAVTLNPASTPARYNAALVAHRLGDNEKARRELGIILSRQPDYQPAIDLAARLR